MEPNNNIKYISLAGAVALVCISFAAVAFGINSLDAMKYPNGQVAQISVSGEGEVTAIPDIATVTFTVRESAKTVPEAQKLTETKIAAGLKELESLGVAKKDTKTLSYTVSPKYESQPVGIVTSYAYPTMKTVITGYEVAQSVTVKVRKVDQAGQVLGLLGKVNITEINGPDFTVDDMDKMQADAKSLAIKNAQEKAEVLAKSLGVSLGSIISFNEDGGGHYPVMYARAMSVGSTQDEVTPSLPTGENVIKSRVTITYSLD